MKRTQRIISLLLVISLLISGFNYNIVYSKEIQKDDEKIKVGKSRMIIHLLFQHLKLETVM